MVNYNMNLVNEKIIKESKKLCESWDGYKTVASLFFGE
jgi:hypothetical protein